METSATALPYREQESCSSEALWIRDFQICVTFSVDEQHHGLESYDRELNPSFIILFSHQSNASDSNLHTVIHSKDRKCPRFCFTRKRAKKRASKSCPRSYRTKGCRNKKGRRGFRCKCGHSRPPKAPSPPPVPEGNGLLIVGGRSKPRQLLLAQLPLSSYKFWNPPPTPWMVSFGMCKCMPI